MTKFSDQRGQAVLIMVLFLGVLMAVGAAVLDVGAWYRADREVQATADAAALAGAQALPESPREAADLALAYAGKNGGGVTAGDIEFSPRADTIKVHAEKPMPGFFMKVFGRDSVVVGADAKARVGLPSSARWVAPIVVDEKHPMLQCKPLPCFGEPTSIGLQDLHRPGSGDAAGAFGLINLATYDGTGNVGAESLGEWVTTGYDGYMKLGNYRSSPSTEFNSRHIQDALDAKITTGDELLFPIYRRIIGSGQTAEYEVVGWVGFVVTSKELKGNNGILFGSFVRVIWEGVQSEKGEGTDYGVRVVHLVE